MKIIYAFLTSLILGSCNDQKIGSNQHQPDHNSSLNEMFTVQLSDGFMGHGGTGEYVVYEDSVMKRLGHNTYTIKSLQPKRFATIVSSILPDKCIGQRVEYSAWVKGSDIKGWAGLWLRIDPDLGFDNMNRRPIQGTSGWTQYRVVLDVPAGATKLVYGLLLDGNGQVWIDSMRVKIVDKNIAKTDSIGMKTL